MSADSREDCILRSSSVDIFSGTKEKFLLPTETVIESEFTSPTTFLALKSPIPLRFREGSAVASKSS